ncbi:hypothetical protein [Streptomyces paromomycinus]|uniref:Uncharacterized protein n=1 Tax=Streptomyces paromomycinus TaxID=92743 RepID=A0A401VW26_STREY|nr:hypothetical protein [Streptomyces paromomycinus]GCD41263.1 hypothetical protein GKJPGBOP_00916 [Streptomyces paromomycinus]
MAAPGVQYSDVVASWGEPEAFAAQPPDPVYCLYGDLELGFTTKGRLWHLQIEPGGSVVSLPSAPGQYVREPVPDIPQLLAELTADGFRTTRHTPFDPEDDPWHRVDRSGVLFRRDAPDGPTRIHSTAKDICDADHKDLPRWD